MLKHLPQLFFAAAAITPFCCARGTAQQPPRPVPPAESPSSTAVAAPQDQIILPAGTRLALMLQSGLSTRTAKPGDSVYFQTIYPVARNNRIVIPMGSFVRGEVVSAKPAGRLKGRAELLIRMNLLTFSNGYTVDLAAIPASLSESSRLFVEDGGKIAAAPGKAIDPASAVGAATLAGLALGTYGGLIGSVSTGSPHALGAGVAAGGGTGLLTGVLVAVFSHGPEAELRPGTTVDAILNHPVLLSASQLPPSTSGVAPVQSTAAPRSEKSPRRCCGLPRPWSFFRP